jgi:hypothetical protein
MSTPILPFAVWASGTNSNATPANDNSLRSYLLNGLIIGTANDESSPSDYDAFIVGSAPTGAYAEFDEDDLAIYVSGTWYAFAPVEGIVVNVAGVLKRWNGTAYVDAATGGTSNRFVNVALSDMTTDLTTGTAKAAWFAPEDGDLVSVYIAVHDPSSSGVVRVDMNDSGGSVFTTRPSIDATEATSLDGTAAVLDGTVSFVRGDKFTFDIDDAGTDAKGLQVCVEYQPA